MQGAGWAGCQFAVLSSNRLDSSRRCTARNAHLSLSLFRFPLPLSVSLFPPVGMVVLLCRCQQHPWHRGGIWIVESSACREPIYNTVKPRQTPNRSLFGSLILKASGAQDVGRYRTLG